jgi:hypothetical protein
MIPHPETLCQMCDLEYEELLRDAALQRRAADAVARSGRRPSAWRMALLAATSWLTGFVAAIPSAKQPRVRSPLPGDWVRSPQQVG